MHSVSSSPLLLGLDTGGTYTDAVLYSEDTGVVAKAKALTTRHDLSVGIAGALDAVFERAAAPASRIGLVSLSTTLATNALVEGQGGSAGLVMIGFAQRDIERDGLRDALGGDPLVVLPGGHDVHGKETPLDTRALDDALPRLAERASAVAVAGYFAVRNPDHEIRVRDRIRAETGLPVTCSHELSSKLGGPRRALTTLLNARLVGMIDRLLNAASGLLAERGIAAPLMIVRGDGALISANEASLRPIETILSGPAASLVGARHLTGIANAVVADIGGTTTDIAVMEGGRPRLDREGAVVGGYRTMVEAVAMRTFGIGGDSQVRFEDGALPARLTLGPRRLLPLSLAGALWPDAVLPVLRMQARAPLVGRQDGLFACRSGVLPASTGALQPHERALFDRLTETPRPLAELLTGSARRATLDRLIALGLAHTVGFTPSDALHVTGRMTHWNGEAANLGATLAARRKDGAGDPFADDARAMAQAVVARLTRQSGEAVLKACLDEDGTSAIDPGASPAVARALDRAPGLVRFALALDRPLIGLGAAAAIVYPPIAELLGVESVVPEDADVANAIGAVVGRVEAQAVVLVTSPGEGIYVAGGAGHSQRFDNEEAACAFARQAAARSALQAVTESGAVDPVVRARESIDAPVVDGRRAFVEARFTATASGRPRVATA